MENKKGRTSGIICNCAVKWKKVKAYIKHPSSIIAFILLSTPLRRILNDRTYIKLRYSLNFKKTLNLDYPQTYTEKLQWLKLYDHNPEYTKMVDKYAMKEWVCSKIGEGYTIKNYGVWDNAEDIDFDSLPSQFVLKATHDSGSFCICKDKSKFDFDAAKKKLNRALLRDQYIYSREWPYKNVPRRIIAEEFLVDESGYELKDYKFFCFDGKPVMMFIASGRTLNETTFDYFDMDFNHLNLTQTHPNASHPYEKPKDFDRMKTLAGKLSEGIPEIRVDFYYVNGKILVGELTFFHYGGFAPFYPDKWDAYLGSFLKLPNVNNENVSI